MNRILVGGTLLLVIFVGVFRQRIFLRDPLGKMERNGVAVDGARLYINFLNDVLVEEPGTERRYLVQRWSGVPGVPQILGCVQGLACWTDADHATVFLLDGRGAGARAVMSAKEITFVDETDARIRVQLR
ncbi:hypothetical protein [Tunturibacter empetritectus]|uniref:Uncharacterized protein n=1 Tax=Tunturiibacter empetritectus TaxID=3069691 RepID=A0A7W8MTU7_9BACT|nr:hypothetical protein [Edaphobacter lichenicola]MBB5318584.1 hypothetical protein [Edaphobacter lichenicola]